MSLTDSDLVSSDSQTSDSSEGDDIELRIWDVAQAFKVCRGGIPKTVSFRTYDVPELHRYAQSDPAWLRQLTVTNILRSCVRRHGKVGYSWKYFRTFEIAEEYCTTVKSMVQTLIRTLFPV